MMYAGTTTSRLPQGSALKTQCEEAWSKPLASAKGYCGWWSNGEELWLLSTTPSKRKYRKRIKRG